MAPFGATIGDSRRLTSYMPGAAAQVMFISVKYYFGSQSNFLPSASTHGTQTRRTSTLPRIIINLWQSTIIGDAFKLVLPLQLPLNRFTPPFGAHFGKSDSFIWYRQGATPKLRPSSFNISVGLKPSYSPTGNKDTGINSSGQGHQYCSRQRKFVGSEATKGHHQEINRSGRSYR